MRSRTVRLVALVPIAVGGALAAVLGCENLIGADFSGQHLVECSPVTFPSPPKLTGAGSGSEFVLVTSKIALGEYDLPDGSPGYATIGYSLDGLCGRDHACAPPAWTGAHPMKGLNGRDNGLGELMHAQLQYFHQVVFHSDTLSENIRTGVNAPLLVLRIAGYSGFVDDDEVEVTLYVASPQGPDGKNFVPKWDGTDEWPLAPAPGPDAGADGGASSAVAETYVDKHAFVSNYTLTAQFAHGATIRFANVPFAATELVVTGKVDPAKKTIVNGIVSGHMGISEMFRHVPEVTQLLLQQTLCTDNPNYALIKKYFCSFADVRVDPKGTGDCDGLSIGVAFETARAKLGTVIDPIAVPACPLETSSDKDSCKDPPK